MNRYRRGHWLVLLLSVMPLGVTGCTSFVNMMAVPYFLIAGEPEKEPPVKILKGKKDHKKLVVLSYAESGLRWGYDAVDSELTSLMIGEMVQAEKRLEVIPERKVRDWRDKTPNWSNMSLQSIGEHFDCDYVMFIEVRKFTLNEAKNQFLLKGNVNVMVKIHDVAKESLVFDDVYAREYPPNRSVSVTDVASEEQFRRLFLRTVAKELSWYVLPHKVEDEFDAGKM